MVAGSGGILLAVLALVSQGLIDDAATVTPSSQTQLCSEYAALMDGLDAGGVFATQANIRSARKLSQLAERYGLSPATGSAEPDVGEAGDDIRRVLESVAWETPDLVAATRPVAIECGWVWPVSATPPPSTPQRPAQRPVQRPTS